jgi:hypothetical protein
MSPRPGRAAEHPERVEPQFVKRMVSVVVAQAGDPLAGDLGDDARPLK